MQLNRGEFRHTLAKSLFFANWGTFRSGDYEEVMNKASCLSLLSNAVLVWNTVHIARIVDQLRCRGACGGGRGSGARLATGRTPMSFQTAATSSLPAGAADAAPEPVMA